MITPSDLVSQLDVKALETEIDNELTIRNSNSKDGVLVIFTSELPSFNIATWYALKPLYAQHWTIADNTGTTIKPRIVFTRPEQKATMIGHTYYPDDK